MFYFECASDFLYLTFSQFIMRPFLYVIPIAHVIWKPDYVFIFYCKSSFFNACASKLKFCEFQAFVCMNFSILVELYIS